MTVQYLVNAVRTKLPP